MKLVQRRPLFASSIVSVTGLTKVAFLGWNQLLLSRRS